MSVWSVLREWLAVRAKDRNNDAARHNRLSGGYRRHEQQHQTGYSDTHEPYSSELGARFFSAVSERQICPIPPVRGLLAKIGYQPGRQRQAGGLDASHDCQ